MVLSKAEKQLIRECSKDEASYQKLLALYDEKLNPEPSKQALDPQVVFESLFNVPKDSIFLLDLEGRILALNDTTVYRLKLPRETLIGRNIFDFFGETRAHREALFDCVVRTNQPLYFEDYRAGVWFGVHVYPVHNAAGEMVAVGILGRDIADRHYLADELYAQKSTYKVIVEQVRDVIFQTDASGRWMFLNRAWETIMGYTTAESLTHDFLNYVHPDDRQQNLEVFLQLVKGQRESYQRQFRYLSQSGDIHHMEVHAHPALDDKGHIIGTIGILRDISERKRIEAELQQSLELQRAILQAMPDLMFRFDADGNYLDIHAGSPDLLYTDVDGLIGKNVRDVFPGDLAAEFLTLIRQTYETQHLQTYEYMLEINGIPHWFESRMVPLRQTEVLSMVRDITEQHQTREGLMASEKRYRSLFEQANDAIFLLDLKGQVMDTNPAAIAMLGYTYDEIITLSHHETVVSAEIGAAEDVIQALQRFEQVPMYERQFRRKDGTVGLSEIRASLITDEDGKPQMIQTVSRDITERRRLENDLRDSELRYRSIITTLAEGIILYERDSSIVLYNEAATRLLGLKPEQMVNRRLMPEGWRSEFEDGTPVNFENHPGMVAMRTGQSQLNVILKITKAAGEITWISINAKPLIHDNATEAYAVVTSLTDITEIKQAQENEIALQVERQKTGMISQFIQDASHEFRTPLSIVNTSSYFIRRGGDDPVQRTKQSAKIELQIQRLTRLVDMLLLMSRLDSEVPPPLTAYDMRNLLVQAVEGIEADYKAKQVTLACNYADEPLMVEIHVDYLHIALEHLLGNALKFTPEQGMVHLSTYRNMSEAVIQIEDNGIGIDTEDQVHIFERFWRKDTAHSTPGFGLGLPIAQKIIELHQGTIAVCSRIGEGTTFSIHLPLVNRASPTKGML